MDGAINRSLNSEKMRDLLGKFIKNNNFAFKEGHIPWNKGKTGIYSLDYIQRLSDVHRGQAAWNKGLKKTTAELEAMSLRVRGEKNPRWKGGVRNYLGQIANAVYREFYINVICEECGSITDLCIHHKDIDRRNNDISNLQALCRQCHGKVHGVILKGKPGA